MPIDYTKRPRNEPPGGTPPPPPAPPVSLQKVTLTKSAPTVSLTKGDSTSGVMRVNLNWNSGSTSPRGLFKSRSNAIDLDLGCLYEYADGSKGAVQALGNAFRDRRAGDPICWLDGDDRSGSSVGGENLYIELKHLAEIRRIIVFALIYEGVPNWAAADGVVTLFPTTGPEIRVELDDHDDRARMCGVALLENKGGTLAISRQVRYVGGHRDLDIAFGWGLNWAPGRK